MLTYVISATNCILFIVAESYQENYIYLDTLFLDIYPLSYLFHKQIKLLQHGILPTNYLRINISSII